MPDTDLERLQERVAAGIVWLDGRDPIGVFHLWFEAGLTPHSHIPDPERKEAYAEYYPQRVIFERLERELARLEGRDQVVLGDPNLQWQPERSKR